MASEAVFERLNIQVRIFNFVNKLIYNITQKKKPSY